MPTRVTRWGAALVLFSCSLPDFRFSSTQSESSCNDALLNGDETDVDCGGSCLACRPGAFCSKDVDCELSSCVERRCQAPHCVNQRSDPDESDVDCGGQVCAACGVSQRCQLDSDCRSHACVDSRCVATGCDNGLLSDDETDRDCGGGTCPACAYGKRCSLGGDCATGVCLDSSCSSVTCADGQRGEQETDVDCGGLMCPRCKIGRACKVSNDCEVGAICQGQLCTRADTSPCGTVASCGGSGGSIAPSGGLSPSNGGTLSTAGRGGAAAVAGFEPGSGGTIGVPPYPSGGSPSGAGGGSSGAASGAASMSSGGSAAAGGSAAEGGSAAANGGAAMGGVAAGGKAASGGVPASGGVTSGGVTSSGGTSPSAGDSGAPSTGSGGTTSGGALTSCPGCARLSVPLASTQHKGHYVITLPAVTNFSAATLTFRVYRETGSGGELKGYIQHGGNPDYAQLFQSSARRLGDLSGWQDITWDVGAEPASYDKTRVLRIGLQIIGLGSSAWTNPSVVYLDSIRVSGAPVGPWTFDNPGSIAPNPSLGAAPNILWINAGDNLVSGTSLGWLGP